MHHLHHPTHRLIRQSAPLQQSYITSPTTPQTPLSNISDDFMRHSASKLDPRGPLGNSALASLERKQGQKEVLYYSEGIGVEQHAAEEKGANLALQVNGTPHYEDGMAVQTPKPPKSRRRKRKKDSLTAGHNLRKRTQQLSISASIRSTASPFPADESPEFMLAPKVDWSLAGFGDESRRTPQSVQTPLLRDIDTSRFDSGSTTLMLDSVTPRDDETADTSHAPLRSHTADSNAPLVQRRKRKYPSLALGTKMHRNTKGFDDNRPKTSLGVPTSRRAFSVNQNKPRTAATLNTESLLSSIASVAPVQFEEKTHNYATVLNYKSNPSEMTFEEICAVMERKLKRKTGYHSSKLDRTRLEFCREALDVFTAKFPRFAYFINTIKKEFDAHIAHYEQRARDNERMVNILQREKAFLEEGHREMFASMESKYKKVIEDIQSKLRVFQDKIETYTVQNLSLQRQTELLLQQLHRQRNKNSILIDLIRRTQDESTVNICVGLMERLEQTLQPEELDALKENIFESKLVDLKQMALTKLQFPHTINNDATDQQNTKQYHEEAAIPNKPRGPHDFASYQDRGVEALLVPGLSTNFFNLEAIVEESCLPPAILRQLSHENIENSVRDIVAEYDNIYFEFQKLKRQQGISEAEDSDTDDDEAFPIIEPHIRVQSKQSSMIFTPQTPLQAPMQHHYAEHASDSGLFLATPVEESYTSVLAPPRDYTMGNRKHPVKEFRYSGRLQLHHFTHVEALKLISDIWNMKLSIDRQVPLDARTEPVEFLLIYLRKMCTEPEKPKFLNILQKNPELASHMNSAATLEKRVLGYVYSLENICERYRRLDVDFAVFYRIIFEGSLHQDLLMHMDAYCGRLRVLMEQHLATHSGCMRRNEFQELLKDFFVTKSNHDMAKLNHALRRMLEDQQSNTTFDPRRLFVDFPDSHPNYFLREIRRQYYFEREAYLSELEKTLLIIAESHSESAWDAMEGDFVLTLEDCCNAIQEVEPAKPLKSLDFVLAVGFDCELEDLQPDLQLQRRVYKADKKVALTVFMQRVSRINIRASFRV